MYSTIPPHTMVQIMSGQQAGGQCLPIQSHTAYCNGANALHQTEYTHYAPDASNHNRHHVVQVCSAPHLPFFYYYLSLANLQFSYYFISLHFFLLLIFSTIIISFYRLLYRIFFNCCLLYVFLDSNIPKLNTRMRNQSRES